MKKLAILISALALGSLSAMAQGNIAFGDQGSGQSISISSNANGSGATLIGGNVAASAALGGGPGQIRFQLYLATNGAAVTFNSDGTPIGMVLVGTATNSANTTSFANGVFNGGEPFLLSAPWDGTFQVEFYYLANTLNGSYRGESAIGTGYTLVTGATPYNNTFGTGGGSLVAGFTLTPVPEPGTILLGGLGAAGLLLFRRRKS